jgi:hypothetical protein
MSPNDTQDDPLVAALQELRAYDVSPARADRLRAQCHKRLEAQDAARHLSRSEARLWRQVAGVLAGVWCVLYLLETIQRAAAVYWF